MLEDSIAFHRRCFNCHHCGDNLCGPNLSIDFVKGSQPGQAFCRKHGGNQMAGDSGVDCESCGQPIVSDYVRATEGLWHPECLVCHNSACRKRIMKYVLGNDGLPYCKKAHLPGMGDVDGIWWDESKFHYVPCAIQ